MRITRLVETTFSDIEHLFAGIILVGVFVHLAFLIPTWFAYTWSDTAMYTDFLEDVFTLAIGVELARLFIFYTAEVVVELVVFVIARKLLFTSDMLSFLLGAGAIALLFAVLIGLPLARRTLAPARDSSIV